jgi:hypothetical protein
MVSADLLTQAPTRRTGLHSYNAARRQIRDARRVQLTALVLAAERPCVATYRWGWAKELGRVFGVHPSIISRDFAAIRQVIVLPKPCCQLCADAKEQVRRNAACGLGRKRAGRWWPPAIRMRPKISVHEGL